MSTENEKKPTENKRYDDEYTSPWKAVVWLTVPPTLIIVLAKLLMTG